MLALGLCVCISCLKMGNSFKKQHPRRIKMLIKMHFTGISRVVVTITVCLAKMRKKPIERLHLKVFHPVILAIIRAKITSHCVINNKSVHISTYLFRLSSDLTVFDIPIDRLAEWHLHISRDLTPFHNTLNDCLPNILLKSLNFFCDEIQ